MRQSEASQEQDQSVTSFLDTFEYRQSQTCDVATSYKELKQVLYKSQGGSKPQSVAPMNAGFLKNTISYQ